MAEIPPLGIEIELPWKTMLHRIDPGASSILSEHLGFYDIPQDGRRERVQRAFDQLDEIYQPKIRQAMDSGIGKGADSFVEFAHHPSRSVEAICDEVNYLYELDLLRDDETYPLHLTVGGLPAGRDAGAILFAAEVTGATTPARMLQMRTWERKGKGGMHAREPAELKLGYTQGVEFRTFVLSSLAQLKRTLLLAQVTANLREVDRPAWLQVRESIDEVAQVAGLDISRPWENPKTPNEQIWQRYARALSSDWRAVANRAIVQSIASSF